MEGGWAAVFPLRPLIITGVHSYIDYCLHVIATSIYIYDCMRLMATAIAFINVCMHASICLHSSELVDACMCAHAANSELHALCRYVPASAFVPLSNALAVRMLV